MTEKPWEEIVEGMVDNVKGPHAGHRAPMVMSAAVGESADTTHVVDVSAMGAENLVPCLHDWTGRRKERDRDEEYDAGRTCVRCGVGLIEHHRATNEQIGVDPSLKPSFTDRQLGGKDYGKE